MKLCPHCKDKDGDFYVDVTVRFRGNVSFPNDNNDDHDYDDGGAQGDHEFDDEKLTCLNCEEETGLSKLIPGVQS